MSISDLSIRRPVFAWMLMAGLIVFGALSFLRMGVSLLPDADAPVISVYLTFDGAAPEIMETTVIDPVESAMMTLQGLHSITSSSRYGAANITLEFNLDRNIDLALQDVQTKLAQIQRALPKEVDPPAASKTNPEDSPILWMAVSSEKLAKRDLMTYVRDHVIDQFTTIDGVGNVFMGGYIPPMLRVWLDDKKMSQYSLTTEDIINTFQTEHLEPPAGKITTGTKEFSVRTLGEVLTPDDFENLIIPSRGGRPNYSTIRLKQVADIEDGLMDIRRISRSSGVPAVSIGIQKQRGSNAVAVGRAVKAKMLQIQKTMPEGTHIAVNLDSTKFIEEAVSELNFTLLLSALLTSLICWLFLGSLSSTFNVLLSIPTSIVGSFTVLYFAGFTLNTFTLLALSLSIGIVVDDAIMVLENIIRHHEMGKSKLEAALTGSKEITFAAVAATISIIAIFLPVAFMKGVIGKYFFQFGVTITVAVLLSLLEALTLTPMRASQFIVSGAADHNSRRERVLAALNRFYKKTLEHALNYRWAVIAFSILFFAASILSARSLNQEMVPREDHGQFSIRLTTPVGSSLTFTDEKFKAAEAFLLTQPAIDKFLSSVGGFGGAGVNTGVILVNMKAKKDRKIGEYELIDVVRAALKNIPDVKVTVQDMGTSGLSSSRGFPVEFTVEGPDWEPLAAYSQKMISELEKTGMVTDVDTDYQVGMPEIQIHPDRNKAAGHGVNVSTIGETINTMIGGFTPARYSKQGHRNEIRVKLKEDSEDRFSKIKNLYVRNDRGELISLADVIKIEEKPALQAISRKNRSRAISVFGNLKAGVSQDKVLAEVVQIGKRILPSDYQLIMGGGSQAFKDSFDSLIYALILGLFVAYMVLASQFNSFLDPFTVLIALPFSISGAFLALQIAHQSINIYSMIGIILLMGIVKKNSILLVDFTNQVRDEGQGSIREALLHACPIRLRPILMTSLATIVGAVPAALAFGPGAESRIPMASAVIGGVIVSTLLTLYVVPCVYSLITRQNRIRVVSNNN